VASQYFLDLYNMGLARASNLPLLSPQLVLGRHVTLYLGESNLGLGASAQPSRAVRARVAGLSAQPALLGLALPADAVAAFNREYLPGKPRQYVQMVALLDKGADRKAVLAEASKLGLMPGGGDIFGQQIVLAVRAAGWVLIALALGIFALGMMTFYMLYMMIFHARRIDLVRLRALGLTPAQAAGLALGEVGGLAAASVALAAGIQAWGMGALARLAQPLTESLTMLPPDLFVPAWGWLGAAALFIFIAALIPALPMLIWIARIEPARVIRDI
jgi:hypothetical protein